MTRTSALQALEDAMAEEMKLMFKILVQGVESNDQKALERFLNGLRFHQAAYDLAIKSITEIFSE